jgi:hypothetical protein
VEARGVSRYPGAGRGGGAAIYFADEVEVRSDYHAGTTWSPIGQTPQVKNTGARYSVNMISAVPAKGALRFAVYEGNTPTLPSSSASASGCCTTRSARCISSLTGPPPHRGKAVRRLHRRPAHAVPAPGGAARQAAQVHNPAWPGTVAGSGPDPAGLSGGQAQLHVVWRRDGDRHGPGQALPGQRAGYGLAAGLGFALGEHHGPQLAYGVLAMAVAVRGGQVPGVILHPARGLRVHRGPGWPGLSAAEGAPVDGQAPPVLSVP